MKLMTADEVKRRLGEGEDALLLSREHWLQIAHWLKEHGELPRHSHGAHVCPLCLKYRDCHNCPLYQSGKHCAVPDGCYSVFLCEPTYENALGVVAALAKCKSPEPELPQFYVWQPGEESQGEVALRLEQRGSGSSITLEANEDMNEPSWWNLLIIRQNGTVRLIGGVGEDIGLDSAGRLRIKREA